MHILTIGIIAAVLLTISQVGAQTDNNGKRDLGIPIYRQIEVDSTVYTAFYAEYYLERTDTTMPVTPTFFVVEYDYILNLLYIDLGNVEIGVYMSDVNGKKHFWLYYGDDTKYLDSKYDDSEYDKVNSSFWTIVPDIDQDNPLGSIIEYAVKHTEKNYKDDFSKLKRIGNIHETILAKK